MAHKLQVMQTMVQVGREWGAVGDTLVHGAPGGVVQCPCSRGRSTRRFGAIGVEALGHTVQRS